MADRTVSVKLQAEVQQYMRNMREAGKATSEMEKASLRVQDALMAEEDAAGKVRVAQARLAEVRKSGRATAAQLAQAEEALASAERSHVRARDRAILITEQYISAQREATEATDESTESVKALGGAAEKVAKRANMRFRMLASTIGATLPAASAAGAAALSAGMGAGFIALGAVALRESERVVDAWSGLGDELSTGLAEDASVLEGAFVDAAEEIGSAYQDLRPELRRAFAASVPYVEDLTGAVTGFAENALPGMVDAVRDAAPVFDSLEHTAAGLGTSLGEFASEMSTYSDEAAQGIEHVGDLADEVLSGMAPILGELTTLWAEHGDEVADVVGRLLDVVGALATSAMPSLSAGVGAALQVLDGLLQVLEPIASVVGPAVGTWLALAGAMRAVGATRSAVRGAASAIGDMGKSLRKANGPAKMFRGVGLGIAFAAGAALDEMHRLTPSVEGLTTSLRRLNNTGQLSGELTEIFGEDLSGVKQALDQLNDGGVTRFLNEIGEAIPGMDALTTTLGESEQALASLDRALVSIAEEGGTAEAQAAFDTLTSKLGLNREQVQQLLDRLPGFTSAMGDVAGATDKASQAAQDAATNLQAYLDKLRAATDPMFALLDATQRVGEAQQSYNEAVAEYGANSPQAQAAAVGLAEAVRDAEIAARNGDLSYAEFSAQLDKWVAQGVLTAAQADAVRVRVDAARGAAERYTGTYTATVRVRNEASGAIRSIQRDIDSLTGKTVRIRVDYYSDSPLSDRSINAGYAGTRGGSFMADGGLVGYADGGRIPGFPGGGFFRGIGGPRDDANLVALSDGEFVTNAADTARNLAALEAGNEGAKLVALGPGGSVVAGMADGGIVRGISMREAVRMAPSAVAQAAPSVTYNLYAPNYVGSHSELLRTLRKEVATTYGGNLQRALGGS